MKSFDEFLEKKFPESRGKRITRSAIRALPRETHHALKDGMDQGPGVDQTSAGGETVLRLCTLGAQSEADAEGRVQREVEET